MRQQIIRNKLLRYLESTWFIDGKLLFLYCQISRVIYNEMINSLWKKTTNKIIQVWSLLNKRVFRFYKNSVCNVLQTLQLFKMEYFPFRRLDKIIKIKWSWNTCFKHNNPFLMIHSWLADRRTHNCETAIPQCTVKFQNTFFCMIVNRIWTQLIKWGT